MRKRYLILLVASVLLSFTVLSGCGKKDDDTTPATSPDTKVEESANNAADDTKADSDIDSGTTDATEESAAEASGPQDRRTDIQKYWNGDWYGWMSVSSTGAYAEFNDEKYDVCGRIEVDENGDGKLTIWYGYEDGDSFDAPTGIINIHITEESDGGTHGTMISTGGWMFTKDDPAGKIGAGEISVKPDEIYSPDCIYINYTYDDGNGTFSPLYALRPWGYTWADDSYYENLDHVMPAFFEWYTPLIEAGWAQPDSFDAEPDKNMIVRQQELIELSSNQSTPVRTDTSELIVPDDISVSDSGNDSGYDSDRDSYYNDSTDFENDLGSSRITHGFDKEIDNPTITGKEYSWGKLSVNIPDGMEVKNGGIADKNDENSLQVTKGTKYFIVSQRYELDALEDVQATTETNDADEVYVTVGDTEWEGAYYEYSGTPCWQIYATVDDACIEVMCYGFDFDSAEAQTVLATAKSTSPIWE